MALSFLVVFEALQELRLPTHKPFVVASLPSFVCSVIFLDPRMSRVVHLQESQQADLEHVSLDFPLSTKIRNSLLISALTK